MINKTHKLLLLIASCMFIGLAAHAQTQQPPMMLGRGAPPPKDYKTPAITEYFTPATATVSPGIPVQLSASVVATGFANKAVTWSVDETSEADGISVDLNGLVTIPDDATVQSVTVTATSVYDTTVTGTATITLAGNESSPSTDAPTEAPTQP